MSGSKLGWIDIYLDEPCAWHDGEAWWNEYRGRGKIGRANARAIGLVEKLS